MPGLTETIALELGAQEPWPNDVKLFQPYAMEQILLPDNASCLSVQAYLHMCGLPFQIEHRANAEFMSPSGKVPFIKCGAFLVSELEPIVQFVGNKGISLTKDLSAEEKADMRAYMSLIHTVLMNAELYICWCDERTYKRVTSVRHGSVYPWPLNHLQNWSKKYHVGQKLKLTGWQKKSLKEIYHEVENCCQALSERLDGKEYFFSSGPCELDALLFGHVYSILSDPLSSCLLPHKVLNFPALMAHCRRVQRTFMANVVDPFRGKLGLYSLGVAQKPPAPRSPAGDCLRDALVQDLAGAEMPDAELGAVTSDVELGAATPDVELGAATPEVELGAATPDDDFVLSNVDSDEILNDDTLFDVNDCVLQLDASCGDEDEDVDVDVDEDVDVDGDEDVDVDVDLDGHVDVDVDVDVNASRNDRVTEVPVDRDLVIKSSENDLSDTANYLFERPGLSESLSSFNSGKLGTEGTPTEETAPAERDVLANFNVYLNSLDDLYDQETISNIPKSIETLLDEYDRENSLARLDDESPACSDEHLEVLPTTKRSRIPVSDHQFHRTRRAAATKSTMLPVRNAQKSDLGPLDVDQFRTYKYFVDLGDEQGGSCYELRPKKSETNLSQTSAPSKVSSDVSMPLD